MIDLKIKTYSVLSGLLETRKRNTQHILENVVFEISAKELIENKMTQKITSESKHSVKTDGEFLYLKIGSCENLDSLTWYIQKTCSRLSFASNDILISCDNAITSNTDKYLLIDFDDSEKSVGDLKEKEKYFAFHNNEIFVQCFETKYGIEHIGTSGGVPAKDTFYNIPKYVFKKNQRGFLKKIMKEVIYNKHFLMHNSIKSNQIKLELLQIISDYYKFNPLYKKYNIDIEKIFETDLCVNISDDFIEKLFYVTQKYNLFEYSGLGINFLVPTINSFEKPEIV